MKGRIVNYKGGAHTQYTNRMIISPEGTDNKEAAEKLIGKAVVWNTPGGNKINGKVTKVHGKNGTVLVKFEKGLPGQAMGSQVDIL